MDEILAFYRKPVPSRHAALFDTLPDDVAGIAASIPALLLHQHIAPAYGETLTPARIAQAQLRPVDDILACVLGYDSAPLAKPRPAGKRAVGVCRHFTLLLVTILRAKGFAARARCGFGAYFDKGKFVDHWLGEYWNGKRWVMVDAQMDEVQKKLFAVDFDPLDVPRGRFVIAGDAWAMCRAGKADPARFGILDMGGWWFIAGNIVRDLAALNDVVMLPWDVWGAMPQPGQDADFARFDGLAELTRDPDAHFAALRSTYSSDDYRLPSVVFNAVLNRPEKV